MVITARLNIKGSTWIKNNNTHTQATTFFVGEFWLKDFRAKFQNITERWRGFHKLRCGSLVDTSIKVIWMCTSSWVNKYSTHEKAILKNIIPRQYENCRWMFLADHKRGYIWCYRMCNQIDV